LRRAFAVELGNGVVSCLPHRYGTVSSCPSPVLHPQGLATASAPRIVLAPAPGYDLDAWRRRIPLLASLVTMNNCSQAPQTDATRAAAERYLESWNRSGMDWDAWLEEVGLAKPPARWRARSISADRAGRWW
jgi:hypothetical protein